VVRLRGAQDTLRKCMFRISYVQRMQFLPSVHVLVQSLVAASLFVLLFLKTNGSYESVLVLVFVSYMFVYALYLIEHLDQPFRTGERTVDDVSIFLLRDFVEKLGRA
jgi:amino acid permease